jgi:hypothetical protein
MQQPKYIAVIGAGFMGCVIATIYARHGYTVVLHDTMPAALENFRERALPIAHGMASASDSAENIVGRVKLVADLDEALAGAQLVHEVVQENLPLKQALFAQLDRLCAPDVVLATNTSSFLLSHLCRDVVHRERVIGIHYITPAHIVPEWYFWPFYAILRAFTVDVWFIPAKLLGVLAMFGSILLLFFLPWLDPSPVRSGNYRPLFKKFTLFGLLPAVLVLGYCGGAPAAEPYVIISQIASAYYFAHFLIILPIISMVERPLPLPNSITEAVLGKYGVTPKTGSAPQLQPAE